MACIGSETKLTGSYLQGAWGEICTGEELHRVGQLFRVETDALTKTESPYQSFQPFRGLQWFQTVLIFPITSCSEACAGWYESPAQKGQLAEG
jgi:hypothetical protein